MVQLYFNAPDATILGMNGTEEFVNEWIHANVVPMDREEIRAAAEEFLMRLREKAARQVLSKLSPAGELQLANAGHNGYSCEGKRREYTPRGDDRQVVPLERMLLGAPRIGSGSHVYVPMIRVQESIPSEAVEEGLPQFLMYNRENYREAEYNIEEAKFIPKKAGSTFEGRQLQMMKQIEVQTNYKKWNNQEQMALMDAVSKLEPNWVGIHFEEMMMWYCKKSWFERRRWKAAIPGIELTMENSTYASFEEIERVVQRVKEDKGNFPRKLNRFLIYKALSTTKQGSFIVGQMTGDTYKIHMPYVRVALRAETIN